MLGGQGLWNYYVTVSKQTWKGAFYDMKNMNTKKMQVKKVKNCIVLNKIKAFIFIFLFLEQLI